jgi:putative transposase
MIRASYTTDLTDKEWHRLAPLLPAPAATGRPRLHTTREILNAIFYLVRSGCAWRLLPHELPPWKTVYHYYRQWRRDGTWERLHAILRAVVRLRAGRNSQASAGIIDSQSVKTTAVGGPRGFDGGKKINGRKRHLLVDTQGLVLKAKVHPASIQDRDGGKLLLEGLDRRLPRLAHLWADGGYNGDFSQWVATRLGWTVALVKHPPKPRGVWAPTDTVIDWRKILPPPGFRVLPRRWVVERTFAWLGGYRRLSKDYERVPETSEALIYIAMIRLMLKRLTRN